MAYWVWVLGWLGDHDYGHDHHDKGDESDDAKAVFHKGGPFSLRYLSHSLKILVVIAVDPA